jgi:LmbE family N-acetylglucosaminyl deacetylase
MPEGVKAAERSMLVCIAHPDDELGVAALASRYLDQGARVTLICTTNGDVGTVDEKYLRGYNTIAELRLAELACATKHVGFSEVVTFGYRDSGMMGAPDNEHPESSWQAPHDALTARVAEVMRRVRPQVVITFNSYGAYGHPDHIKIHQATLAAFEQLQSEPEHPEKLYYTTINARLARGALRLMKLLRKDPRKMGRNADVDLQAAVESITPITTRVRIRGRDRARSRAARKCHASQISVPPLLDLVGRLLGPLFSRATTLSRVIPEPKPGERIERNLLG